MGCSRAQLSLLFVCAVALAFDARGEVTIRDPGTFVVDHGGIISAGHRRTLEAWLAELQQKTGIQVKILTVKNMDGEDVFSFAQRHAELWKLGRKGKDDGALLVAALKERKLRIQTGYGLEGTLPDSWCGSLSRDVAKRYFKRGQYSDGMVQLTGNVAHKVAALRNGRGRHSSTGCWSP